MCLKTDFLPTPVKALPISHPARQYFMISQQHHMPIRHVRNISFVASFFIYDEEVTLRKRKSVLGHFAATETCKLPCVRFLS